RFALDRDSVRDPWGDHGPAKGVTPFRGRWIAGFVHSGQRHEVYCSGSVFLPPNATAFPRPRLDVRGRYLDRPHYCGKVSRVDRFNALPPNVLEILEAGGLVAKIRAERAPRRT